MSNNKTVILLYTPQAGIGKTTLATELSSRLDSIKMSFALDIKYLALSIHNILSDINIASSDFIQDKKDIPLVNNYTPRDITCIISDTAQKIYGENIWAAKAYSNISSGFSNSLFIFDDWRRHIESDYLKSKSDLKVITVFLTKEGITPVQASEESSAYENNIKAEDCDLHLVYKEDYSNYQEIIESLIKTIKG